MTRPVAATARTRNTLSFALLGAVSLLALAVLNSGAQAQFVATTCLDDHTNLNFRCGTSSVASGGCVR